MLKPINRKLAAALLEQGKVGVIATDTLYGLVGSALKPEVVERIRGLKRRNHSKPFIVLIGELIDLLKFGIVLNRQTAEIIKKFWPGPTTIVLRCPLVSYKYLHRGKKTIAFRLPADPDLRKFLTTTGPLVAPTANPAGLLPATTILEAQKYFTDQVDFYLDAGEVKGPASTIIAFKNGKIKTLRAG